MPLKESTPRKLDPITLADLSCTVGPSSWRFSSAGAAKARGRRHVAKPMRVSMMADRYLDLVAGRWKEAWEDN